jgi:hypothetical protein
MTAQARLARNETRKTTSEERQAELSKSKPGGRNLDYDNAACSSEATCSSSAVAPLCPQILAFNLDGNQLRLLFAQAAQQIARCGDPDQSQHDGHADHQMRIHESLVLQLLRRAERQRPGASG